MSRRWSSACRREVDLDLCHLPLCGVLRQDYLKGANLSVVNLCFLVSCITAAGGWWEDAALVFSSFSDPHWAADLSLTLVHTCIYCLLRPPPTIQSSWSCFVGFKPC